MKKILLVCIMFLSIVASYAQTTVTIGTGTTNSVASAYASPIYRSTAASSFNYSQSVQLLTSADLAAAGIPSGATITKIAYYKGDAQTLTSGRTATIKLYMKNSSATALNSTTTFSMYTAGATNVYSNSAFGSASTDLPAAAGWVEFVLSSPFTYTGGAIETGIDWMINSGTGNPSTGGFTWQFTSVTANQAAGTASNAAIAGALSTAINRLYNVRISYNVTPCSGTPAPGNTLATTTSGTCPGPYQTTFSLQNPTLGSGVTYQWYKDGTAIAGATNNTYVTSITASGSYYAQVSCSGNVGSSAPVSVAAPIPPTSTLPFIESFETGNTQDAVVGNCWQQISIGGLAGWLANNNLIDYNRSPRTGSWNAYLQWSNEDWMIYPLTLTAGTNYTFEVYARQDMGTATDADVTLAWSTSNDPATFTTVAGPTGIINGSYQKISGSFTPTFTGGATTGVVYIALKGKINASPYYISIDDIKVDVTPACAEPTLLAVTNLTTTGATINWNAPSAAPANGYQYSYSTTNTPPSVGTATTATTVNLSSLTQGTTYYYWVRSVCSGTVSTWASGSFMTPLPPPSNDNCSGAVTLTAGGTFSQNAVTGTTVSATEGTPASPSCSTSSTVNVWYKVVVPASGSITVETDAVVGSALTDTVLSAYTTATDCGGLTEVTGGCDDDSGNGSFSKLSLTGLTPGSTLYISVWRYGSVNDGQFKVSAYDASLGTSDIGSVQHTAQVYPNPFVDVLQISDSKDVRNVTVMDVSGRIIKDIENPSRQINLGDLKSGVYILKLLYKDGSMKNVKVIKK